MRSGSHESCSMPTRLLPGATADTRRVLVVDMPGAGKGRRGRAWPSSGGAPHLDGRSHPRAGRRGDALRLPAQVFIERAGWCPTAWCSRSSLAVSRADDVRTAGFVLDGFPRSIEQAVALEALLGPRRSRWWSSSSFQAETAGTAPVAWPTSTTRTRRSDDGSRSSSATAPVLYWYRSRAETRGRSTAAAAAIT